LSAAVSHLLPWLRRFGLGTLLLVVVAAAAQARDTEATIEVIAAPDGYELPLWSWVPFGDPKAVIVALHGFRDHSGSFERPARSWRARGVATYAFDLRGFGATAKTGRWPGAAIVFDDAAYVVNLVAARHPGVPVFLLGESLGSAVLLANAARTEFPEVRGLIVVAPGALGWQAMPAFAKELSKAIVGVVPELRLPATGPFSLATDNRAVLAELDRDPLVQRSVRVDTLAGVIDTMDVAITMADDLPRPTLVLYGENDRVIPGWVRRDFLRQLDPKAEVRGYPDGYHLLLRDLGAQVVIDDILAWVTTAAR
jgi:acylglycerol lipase